MPSESTFVWDESFKAAVDFSSASTFFVNAYTAAQGLQFFIVASSAASGKDGIVNPCVTSTGTGTLAPMGVIQNNPTSGHAANIRLLGRSKVVASSSGTISYGAYITASTWGSAVSCATSGDHVLGIARSASTGGVGQLIEADLFGGFNYVIGG